MRTTILSMLFTLCALTLLSQENLEQVTDTIAPAESDDALSKPETESLEMVPISSESIQRRENSRYKKQKDGVIHEEVNMERQFDLHLANYKNADIKSEAGDELLKALSIKPNDIGLLDELMSYYEITGDEASIKQTAKKMFKKKKYPESILTYQDNIIGSLEKGAILITNGDWDTYPLIGKLALDGHDLIVINIHLLSDPVYRSQRLVAKGLSIPSSEYKGDIDFLQKLFGLNPSRQMHFGLTVEKRVLKNLRENLHLAGLTFKYGGVVSAEEVVKSWEEDMKSDHLGESDESLEVNQLHMNYLPMLSIVRSRYTEMQEEEKSAEVGSLMVKIAAAANRTEVLDMLK